MHAKQQCLVYAIDGLDSVRWCQGLSESRKAEIAPGLLRKTEAYQSGGLSATRKKGRQLYRCLKCPPADSANALSDCLSSDTVNTSLRGQHNISLALALTTRSVCNERRYFVRVVAAILFPFVRRLCPEYDGLASYNHSGTMKPSS
jgi:hypothetical protein